MNKGKFFGKVQEWMINYKSFDPFELSDLTTFVHKNVEQLSEKDARAILVKFIVYNVGERQFLDELLKHTEQD